MKRIYLLAALGLTMAQFSAQTYCLPEFASGCSGGDMIDSFTVPAAGFAHTDTGCSAGSYEDFSSTLTLTLQPSLPYDFTVTHDYSGQYVSIWADFNNDGTFDPTTELIGSGSSGSGMQTASTITVPAGTPVGTYRMRVADRWNSAPIPCNVSGYGEAHDYTLAVTAPPSCIVPGNFAASNILPTSAVLTWTAPTTPPANGYTVYYSTVNAAPTATTVLDATNSLSTPNLTATLNGLNPTTTYYAWIRTNCTTTDQSIWVASTGSFTTLCATFTPNYSNDFSTFPGACWSQATGGAPATGPGTGTSTYWYDDGFLNNGNTGAAKFNIYSTDRTGWLISPVFDLSAGGYRVKFDYGVTEYADITPSALGSDDLVQFLISTDGGVTWTVLQTWDATNSPSNTTNTYTYNLTTYTGNSTRFALYVTSGTTNDAEDLDFFTDNFAVEAIPTCDSTTNILVDAATVTATGGSITFTPSVSTPAGGYQVYFSTVNSAPTGATVLTPANSVTTASSPAIITGLSAATTYYVWVRSVCSANDMSVWTGGVQLTTACATITPAYTNDFSAFPGVCWEQASGGTPATGPTGTSANWYNDGFLNSGPSGAAGINLYSDFTTGWLMSPTFDLSAGPYTLTFDYGLVEWADTTSGVLGSDDQVQVLMSTNGGSTWTVLHTWDASSAISNTSTTYAYVVNGGTNQTKFAIYATEGSTNDAEDVEFFVDNFGLAAGALGVGEITADSKEVKVYPNPFTDVVNITEAKDLKSVTVIDMSGRLVKTIANPGRQINLSELKAGLYILKLDYKDGTSKSVKAIKK
ncbi:fibronectin type III domain-containing protein [Marnyiella aurantia]|uniref:Fibronectin type III domain-containing protein n=1 Tax=Marnyiella aurantia TaxID=2758037 RepID=A0A7D7QYY8_9FLAO|nr:GEVED domain-containing protein [Marnyiella aurantia]MBA5247326.1 fibronectin type III domain-containing protein [Marnyiella aurantia]QMS99086.1 fibronectin type III domain-containing protein [Marnyiella aurantia]